MAEWKISNDLPYLDEFPALYQISDCPNVSWAWRISDDIPYKLSFPPLYPPREEKPRYKTFPIILYDYHETITIRKDVK